MRHHASHAQLECLEAGRHFLGDVVAMKDREIAVHLPVHDQTRAALVDVLG